MPVINDAALDLICEYEGFEPHWYPDVVHGWKVPTVAYGHTDAAGEPKYAATKSKTFTKAEGRLILERDLAQYAAAVHAAVKVPLNDNQFGALVSFTYNLGAKNLNKSTLVKKLNAGDFEGAAKEFRRWNRAGGKILRGLVRRRAAEEALFLTPSGQKPGPAPEVPADQPPAATGIWRAVAALIEIILNLIRSFRK
jgi:lysozyme